MSLPPISKLRSLLVNNDVSLLREHRFRRSLRVCFLRGSPFHTHTHTRTRSPKHVRKQVPFEWRSWRRNRSKMKPGRTTRNTNGMSAASELNRSVGLTTEYDALFTPTPPPSILLTVAPPWILTDKRAIRWPFNFLCLALLDKSRAEWNIILK